jgi:hypothetical protein
MVFWMAVVVGALFAWIAVQIGFFATWIMLFNLVFSAYMAVFLGPVIIENVPAATSTSYGYALVLMSVAIGTLLISYGICYACLSGQLRVELPKAFDGIAAGLLGFLSGFLISSFVSFAIVLTPLPQTDTFRTLGVDLPSQKANMAYLRWWCDLFHSMVSSSDADVTSQDAFRALLEKVEPQAGGPSSSSAYEAPVERKSASPPQGGKTATSVAPKPPPATRETREKFPGTTD